MAGYPPPANDTVLTMLDVQEGSDGDKEKPDIHVVGLQEVHARMDKYLMESIVTGEDPWTKVFR